MQHSDEVRSLLSRIHSLEEELMQSRLVAEDAAHDMKKLQDQVRDAEQQADAAIKAQNNLQAVESKYSLLLITELSTTKIILVG